MSNQPYPGEDFGDAADRLYDQDRQEKLDKAPKTASAFTPMGWKGDAADHKRRAVAAAATRAGSSIQQNKEQENRFAVRKNEDRALARSLGVDPDKLLIGE